MANIDQVLALLDNVDLHLQHLADHEVCRHELAKVRACLTQPEPEVAPVSFPVVEAEVAAPVLTSVPAEEAPVVEAQNTEAPASDQ